MAILGSHQVELTVCSGCSGFVAQFRDVVARKTNATVEVSTLLPEDDSVPRAVEVVSGSPADGAIASADVIVVDVGGGNILPDPDTKIGCRGSLGDGSGAALAAWIRSTTPRCMAKGVKTYGTLFDQVFEGMKRLRGDRPTVWIVMNPMNANIDPNDGQSLLAVVPEKDRPFDRAWALAAYERWNAMLKDRAAAAGFTLVDVWHDLNGPDGTAPPRQFTLDGAHLSQAGNDRVAKLLASVDLSALTSR